MSKSVQTRMANLIAMAAVLTLPEIANSDQNLGNDVATFWNDAKRTSKPFDEVTAVLTDNRRNGAYTTELSAYLSDPANADQVERIARNNGPAIERIFTTADQVLRARGASAATTAAA